MATVVERPAVVAPSVLDALLYPDGTAAGLACSVPQAVLVEPLAELVLSGLSEDGQIDALVAVERHIAMMQARSAELLAALDAASNQTKDGFTRESVAAALKLPPASMKARMSIASDLAQRLPATLEMLRAGQISQRHAHDLVDATRALPVEKVAVVEAAVVGRAPEQTAARFRAAVKRAVLRVSSPADEQAAHEADVADRRVELRPAANGMAELWAFLPAPDAARVMAALNTYAQKRLHGPGGDDRPADPRRADALVELTTAVLGDPTVARAHGRRPDVQVTLAASTLMGLDDQAGELDRYGPITAELAPRITADHTATWRRLLTTTTATSSTPPPAPTTRPRTFIRTVIARDQHCTFPGCRRHARYTDLDHDTDLDHVKAWHDDDETAAANLQSLCRRHHRLKHETKWKVERDDPTGLTTWTDDHNRQYESRPPDLPTTTTATKSGEPSSNDPPPFGTTPF